MEANSTNSNVILFRTEEVVTHEQTSDSRYLELIKHAELRDKYWSHICPGIGLIASEGSICGRCLQTKPTEQEQSKNG